MDGAALGRTTWRGALSGVGTEPGDVGGGRAQQREEPCKCPQQGQAVWRGLSGEGEGGVVREVGGALQARPRSGVCSERSLHGVTLEAVSTCG